MNQQRRTVVKLGGWLALLAATGVFPIDALADDAIANALNAKTMDDVLKALGGQPTVSGEIILNSPDIAENGAVVPVSITSKLANTQQILIIVEKNPNPLTAAFDIPTDTEPYVQTRVKMGQSGNVYAVVKADGKLYSTFKETKVTLGGCGG